MTKLSETAECWYLPADECGSIVAGLNSVAGHEHEWTRVHSFTCEQVSLGCVQFRAEVGGVVDVDDARLRFRDLCEMHCRGNENIRLKPPNTYPPPDEAPPGAVRYPIGSDGVRIGRVCSLRGVNVVPILLHGGMVHFNVGGSLHSLDEAAFLEFAELPILGVPGPPPIGTLPDWAIRYEHLMPREWLAGDE